MGITIKEIADIAGVSIATVSHVINKTRYVSPDLVEKVERSLKRRDTKKIFLTKPIKCGLENYLKWRL